MKHPIKTRRNISLLIIQLILIIFLNTDYCMKLRKAKKVEKAGIAKLKYYLYYLKKRGVEGLKGRIDFPLLKQSIEVELAETDEMEIEKVVKDIVRIVSLDLPPKFEKLKICKSCAYYDLCCI